MAHLEVEPKPSRPLWIWALIIIILIALATTAFMYYTDSGTGHPTVPDTTSNVIENH